MLLVLVSIYYQALYSSLSYDKAVDHYFIVRYYFE